jgi:hypothetical protein
MKKILFVAMWTMSCVVCGPKVVTADEFFNGNIGFSDLITNIDSVSYLGIIKAIKTYCKVPIEEGVLNFTLFYAILRLCHYARFDLIKEVTNKNTAKTITEELIKLVEDLLKTDSADNNEAMACLDEVFLANNYGNNFAQDYGHSNNSSKPYQLHDITTLGILYFLKKVKFLKDLKLLGENEVNRIFNKIQKETDFVEAVKLVIANTSYGFVPTIESKVKESKQLLPYKTLISSVILDQPPSYGSSLQSIFFQTFSIKMTIVLYILYTISDLVVKDKALKDTKTLISKGTDIAVNLQPILENKELINKAVQSLQNALGGSTTLDVASIVSLIAAGALFKAASYVDYDKIKKENPIVVELENLAKTICGDESSKTTKASFDAITDPNAKELVKENIKHLSDWFAIIPPSVVTSTNHKESLAKIKADQKIVENLNIT